MDYLVCIIAKREEGIGNKEKGRRRKILLTVSSLAIGILRLVTCFLDRYFLDRAFLCTVTAGYNTLKAYL
ncbi:MAG: hypothetical protein ACRC62_02815 [Microcoleus sp.]